MVGERTEEVVPKVDAILPLAVAHELFALVAEERAVRAIGAVLDEALSLIHI